MDNEGVCTAFDLPMTPWEDAQATKTANACLEVITNAEVGLDFAELDAMMSQGSYNNLPEPLCPATNTELPMHMNLNVSKGSAEGRFNIVKYYTFLKPERRDVVEEQLVTGVLMSINWVPDRCNTKKALQYLFERLPGITYKHWVWQSPVAAAGPVDDTEVSDKQQRIKDGIQGRGSPGQLRLRADLLGRMRAREGCEPDLRLQARAHRCGAQSLEGPRPLRHQTDVLPGVPDGNRA